VRFSALFSYAQVLRESDENDNLIVSYTYGDDLISQNRNSSLTYYHYDGQLSTRQLSDANSQVTDMYTYDAFGLLLNRSGATENNYMYTGEQYDPNVGFYYLRARYYNASIGRFLTQDTWPGLQFEPVSLHKYLYCEGNPVGRWDPSGHMANGALTFVGVVLTIIIIGILASIIQARIPFTGESVKWSGYISNIAFGQWAEIAVAGTLMRSEANGEGRSGAGIYLILLGGITPLPLPVSGSLGKINVETPGRLGANPWTLVGGVGYVSATAGPLSIQPYFRMGFGKDFSGGPYLFKSIGLNAEGASGISFLTGIRSSEPATSGSGSGSGGGGVSGGIGGGD